MKYKEPNKFEELNRASSARTVSVRRSRCQLNEPPYIRLPRLLSLSKLATFDVTAYRLANVRRFVSLMEGFKLKCVYPHFADLPLWSD
jgi:hypothetical protein